MRSSRKVHRYIKVQFCMRTFLFCHKYLFSNRLNSVPSPLSADVINGWPGWPLMANYCSLFVGNDAISTQKEERCHSDSGWTFWQNHPPPLPVPSSFSVSRVMKFTPSHPHAVFSLLLFPSLERRDVQQLLASFSS